MNFKNVLKNNTVSFKAGLILILFGLVLLVFGKFKDLLTQKSYSPVITPAPISLKVVKIIDGDSIVLSDGSEVRYIGIDTPEIQLNDCYATEAAKANSDLVLGKEVTIIGDTSDKDKYGRLLRYIYVGDQFVNDYLVKNGFAKVMTVLPDTKFSNEFAVSENYARQNLLGLWGKCLKK